MLAGGSTLQAACDAVGVNRRTGRRWRQATGGQVPRKSPSVCITAGGSTIPLHRKKAHPLGQVRRMSVENVVCQTPSPGVDELQNQIRNLDAALQTARVIGQAQGLLMAQSRCTAQGAFNQLVQMSQHLNIKLHLVAAEFVCVATYTTCGPADGAAASSTVEPERPSRARRAAAVRLH